MKEKLKARQIEFKDEMLEVDDAVPTTVVRSARTVVRSAIKTAPLITNDRILRGFLVNGTIYPYSNVGRGAQHQVIRLTDANRTITWMTKGGPVSFNSDQVVIRCLHPDLATFSYQRRLRSDMKCYEIYVARGLAVPKMYIRPDIGMRADGTHLDTFVDTVNPETTGAFSVVEKVEAGFTADALKDANSLAEVAVIDPRTGELMQFAIGEWKKFVRFMASQTEAPYFDARGLSCFSGKSALFNDFKPDNIGRNAHGFLHLDQLTPKLCADNLLYKSINSFAMKNKRIFEEIVGELLSDSALAGSLKSPGTLAAFQQAVFDLLLAHRKADHMFQYKTHSSDRGLF